MNTTTETQLEFEFNKTPNPLVIIKPDLIMTFHMHEKIIGTLDWNGGIMKFSGSVDESAQIFFDCLIKKYSQNTLFDQKQNDAGWKS